MKKTTSRLLTLLLLSLASTTWADLPIPPSDPHLHYQGRWDTSNHAAAQAQWSGSSVTLKFHGTAASVKLKNEGDIYYQIILDGQPTDVIHPPREESTIPLAKDLPLADHTIQLFRRTEAFTGTTNILGFLLPDDAKLLNFPKPAHSIQIIGDSISCGFGNEGKSQNEHFSPATENNYLTYGAIAARAFQADFACIAWSGKKLWPDNDIPSIYDHILPNGGAAKVDFHAEKPDLILINLATNDFARGIPDQAKWTAAYIDFIARLRTHNPTAFIYLATGSMMSDGYPPNQKALTTLKSYLTKIVAARHAAGDQRVKKIDFAPQDQANGIGSDWHPSVKTHQLMAETLQSAIQSDLHWKVVSKE